MSSEPADGGGASANGRNSHSVEFLLFDSLIHHLIEKGLLTKNDALSVIQTAAEVVRGQIHESGDTITIDSALATLERIYSSFEALPDRYGRVRLDVHNVLPLRTPLHGDHPQFPRDEGD